MFIIKPSLSCPFGTNTQYVATSPHTGGINVGVADDHADGQPERQPQHLVGRHDDRQRYLGSDW